MPKKKKRTDLFKKIMTMGPLAFGGVMLLAIGVVGICYGYAPSGVYMLAGIVLILMEWL